VGQGRRVGRPGKAGRFFGGLEREREVCGQPVGETWKKGDEKSFSRFEQRRSPTLRTLLDLWQREGMRSGIPAWNTTKVTTQRTRTGKDLAF
jgi:hypothetical protein